jgi:hypothetical protein
MASGIRHGSSEIRYARSGGVNVAYQITRANLTDLLCALEVPWVRRTLGNRDLSLRGLLAWRRALPSCHCGAVPLARPALCFAGVARLGPCAWRALLRNGRPQADGGSGGADTPWPEIPDCGVWTIPAAGAAHHPTSRSPLTQQRRIGPQ